MGVWVCVKDLGASQIKRNTLGGGMGFTKMTPNVTYGGGWGRLANHFFTIIIKICLYPGCLYLEKHNNALKMFKL